MLGAIVFFLIIALLAAIFGFVDIAATAIALLVIGVVSGLAYERSHSRNRPPVAASRDGDPSQKDTPWLVSTHQKT